MAPLWQYWDTAIGQRLAGYPKLWQPITNKLSFRVTHLWPLEGAAAHVHFTSEEAEEGQRGQPGNK